MITTVPDDTRGLIQDLAAEAVHMAIDNASDMHMKENYGDHVATHIAGYVENEVDVLFEDFMPEPQNDNERRLFGHLFRVLAREVEREAREYAAEEGCPTYQPWDGETLETRL